MIFVNLQLVCAKIYFDLSDYFLTSIHCFTFYNTILRRSPFGTGFPKSQKRPCPFKYIIMIMSPNGALSPTNKIKSWMRYELWITNKQFFLSEDGTRALAVSY